MWTSTIEHRTMSPNHIVPLLALADVPGIPCKEDILVSQLFSFFSIIGLFFLSGR